MWTWHFWKQAIERAIKTGAQAAVAILGVSGLGILDVNWKQTASVVGLATIASVFSSLATYNMGQEGSPSAVAVTSAAPAEAPAAPPKAAEPAVPAEPVVPIQPTGDGDVLPDPAPAD